MTRDQIIAMEGWHSMVRSKLDIEGGERTFRFVWWIEVYTGAPDLGDRKRLEVEVVPCPEPPRGTLSHPLKGEPESQLTLAYDGATVSMLLPLTEALALAERITRLIDVGEGGG